MILINFFKSRGFYIGFPILCIIFGLLGAAGSLIAGAVNNTYHPVLPTADLILAMKVYGGLACAGLVSLLLMAIFKFGFRSPRRTSVVAFSLGLWLLGVIWLNVTSVPGEDAYKRTFEAQRYVIPWSRVTGEMTSQGNSLRQWASVSKIGFRYCAKPFSVEGIGSNCDRRGSFLARTENLTGNGYLSNTWLDRDGRNLRKHLEKQQIERETPSTPISQASTLSSTSTGSSSSSGGSTYKPWEEVDAIRQPAIGGMIAFKRVSDFLSDDAIYLFSKEQPTDTIVHHAECRRGIRNGQVEDSEFICTHFVRADRKAWSFDLRLDETARFAERLAQLKSQLDGYRIPSSPAKSNQRQP